MVKILLWIAVAATLTAQGLAAPAGEAKPRYTRTEEKYAMPDVTLVNQNGERIKFRDFLKTEKPILLDFIYGTCTTICPVLSAGFSNMQRKLAPDPAQVRLVSISIDPENDTPEVMRAYLKRYGAKPGWEFLTGSRTDIDQVMRAFKAYVPNKMSHYPITFLLAPGEEEWVRIYGLIGTKELMEEYKRLSTEEGGRHE